MNLWGQTLDPKQFGRALAALGRTGVFRPAPLRSVLQLAWCGLRHGASLYTLVAWNAWRWPDRTAVDGDGEAVSYQDLWRRADHLASILSAYTSGTLGRPLDFGVALLCRNHVNFVALLLACSRLGLRTVLLNTSFLPEQVRAACHSQGLTLLICDDEFAPGLAEIGLAEVGLAEVEWAGAGMNIITVSALKASTTARPPTLRLALLRWRPRPRWRQATLVLLTSGTTRTPRTVQRRLHLGALLPTLIALLSSLRPEAGSPTLLTLPLFHGHGLATLGLSLTLAAPLHLFARGRPKDYWRCLTQQQIEVLVLVPTVLYRLLSSAERGLPLPTPPALRTPALRTIVSGSAPLGAALATQAQQAFGPVLFNLYGSSEAGLISLATPQDLLLCPGTVGRVLPGVEVQLQPLSSAEAGLSTAGLDDMEVGQVRVRGPLVVGNAASTDAGTECYETGDLGWFGSTGLLFLAGRHDDLLMIGGENVSPELIEDRIARLPCVLECAVTPVPSAEYGQAVHAYVVLKRGQEHTTPADLQHHLLVLLPRMLRPAEISVVKTLPRNQMGKLLRAQLNTQPVEPESVNTEPV